MLLHYLPNQLVLLCLEMNWRYFVITLLCMYHVRKKLYELLYTFGPEKKLNVDIFWYVLCFCYEYCYDIYIVIHP